VSERVCGGKDYYPGAAGQENRQLFAAINQVEAELMLIEKMLGLREKNDGPRNPPYSDVPSRLADQGRRLSIVQEALSGLLSATEQPMRTAVERPIISTYYLTNVVG